MFKRIILVVMDSVGIGAMPDAAAYDDVGANTLGNIAKQEKGIYLPALEKLGLGNIEEIEGVKQEKEAQGYFGKLQELSCAKDTISGHWEMMGYPVFAPFPLYPNGFPKEIIDAIARYSKRSILGNIPASGTEIIERLGEEHMRTGALIVYTSGDSVLQIAAHENVVPINELYDICNFVRNEVCIGEHAFGRIIARPFVGSSGNFTRTANRHDYSLMPELTVLDLLKADGLSVTGIGKIGDIFAQRGLSKSLRTSSNDNGMQVLQQELAENKMPGLIFLNLLDFDSMYGHRRDPVGYAKALERLDGQLSLIIPQLKDDDLLILTADHGCDPTHHGTDHTREYTPLIVYHMNAVGKDLGTRSTFADIGQTIAENFGLKKLKYGQSFLSDIR